MDPYSSPYIIPILVSKVGGLSRDWAFGFRFLEHPFHPQKQELNALMRSMRPLRQGARVACECACALGTSSLGILELRGAGPNPNL